MGQLRIQMLPMPRLNHPVPFRDAVLTLIILMFFATPAFSQGGASTASADLDQLVQRAQTIVRGRVVSAVLEAHPQFPNIQTLVIALSVSNVLKGSAGSTLIIRQFQMDARDTTSLAAYKGEGEVLLFLNPVSQYGLTSTVGQEQGRFRVLTDEKGNRYVLNGRGNLGLFREVRAKATARGLRLTKPVQDMLADSPGKSSLSAFEESVRLLAGTPK